MTEPKYPDITVDLTHSDGNAFMIVGRTRAALRREGVPETEMAQYQEEAMSGDCDNLLQTTMKWVNVT